MPLRDAIKHENTLQRVLRLSRCSAFLATAGRAVRRLSVDVTFAFS
jgi:hypothetical protein